MLMCRFARIYFCSLLVGLLFQSCSSQSSAAVCRNGGDQVVLGSPFGLQLVSALDSNCSFESIDGDGSTNLRSQDSQYTLYSIGRYSYNCTEGGSGNVTVVPALYNVLLCKECSIRRSQFHLTTGDSLHWTLLPDDVGSDWRGCNMSLHQSDGQGTTISVLSDSAQYQFLTAGTFYMHCLDDEGFNATIIVEDSTDETLSKELLPLVYTHVALMALAFAVLLPIGAYLYSCQHSVTYYVFLLLSWVFSIVGMVAIVVYIELTGKKHAGEIIHAVVGYVLMAVFVLALPLLLLHQKLKAYHKRLGHVVVVFGLKNVLTGLSILPAPFIASVSLCVIYGCWLIIMVFVYVFYSVKKPSVSRSAECDLAMSTSFKMKEKPKSNGSLMSHQASSSSISRGPQPLKKNIICDTKMVELRKKSIDFLGAQRQMKQLNDEHGVKHQLAKQLEEEEDESFKVRMEQKAFQSSSPEEQDYPDSYDRDDSRAPLHPPSPPRRCRSPPPPQPSSPEIDDPFSLDPNCHPRCFSFDEEDEDRIEDDVHCPRSHAAVTRASTFNYSSNEDHTPDVEKKRRDSDNDSERGGSVRITRHSKRARVKLENMFDRPNLSGTPEVAALSGTPEVAVTDPPSFSITPSTPPILERHTHTIFTPQGSVGTNKVEEPTTTTPTASRRRRKTAISPIIIDPSSLNKPAPVPSGCPFQSSLIIRSTSPTGSSKSCQRTVSPTPSSGGEDGNAPRKRKKKVSVAQIEATVVPPTPINKEPPPHVLSRSPSFSTPRSHQDAFTDNAFRSIMQISQNAIVCANNVGDIVFWSAGACKMFGYTPGEAVGSSLEMIIPISYKERHRNGISKRTEETMKYLRKHNYAPEEQKHARLYEVRGVTKGGHEFPVEVNVTSFVLDGEMFFTGVISELAKTKDSKRSSVSSSVSDINEVALQQRALAVGAQMKMSHNLRSAEHISRREMEKLLRGSLGTSFEVDSHEMEQMINGIMKAGDPENTGAVSFVKLIQLLAKHQLYISESGHIARYGKTKGSESSSRNGNSSILNIVQEFLYCNASLIIWTLLYVVLNLGTFVAGVTSYSFNESINGSWTMWAYGAGPVLSMNCVLVLLPTLLSLIYAMRGSGRMNVVFPLKKSVTFHVIITIGIAFWAVVHVATHLTSFAMDSADKSFEVGMRKNIVPTVTGLLVIITLVTLAVTSIKPLRSLAQFIPFHLIHWIGGLLFYILLLLHGIKCWNPSFWKWLVPSLIIFIIERIYRHKLIQSKKVKVISAGRYDSVSRTAIVELEKPRYMQCEPGQFILLNLPRIGKFEWKACYVSSGPKEKKLVVHIPFSENIWFKNAFEYLKAHPHNMPSGDNRQLGKNAKPSLAESLEDLPGQFPAYFTGPYGTLDGINKLFRYKISTLVCGGEGPHAAKAVLKKFLDYRKAITCYCGCQPILSKLYFVWVIPNGNDFEWFTDYLSELCEDEHLHHYLDIRVFLTNCDSAPDELASALLQLGLKTAGDTMTVRRPSQPQLNNLYQMTSYGVPDFSALLAYISSHHSSLWKDKDHAESGVFSIGDLNRSMNRDLLLAIDKTSKPGQIIFRKHRLIL